MIRTPLEISEMIKNETIDINTQENFLSKVIKGAMYDLNEIIKVRGKNVPHLILSTGDDTMYLDVKGQNQAIEPQDISNENYVYSVIPRGVVTPSGINLETDQLSSPYTRGRLQVEHDDVLYEMTAEFRRMPMTMRISIKYILDTFTDTLNLMQYVITHLSFVRTFNIIYMGQQITCSYRFPEAMEEQFNAQFDGLSMDAKYKTVEIELEVETNVPVFYPRTVIPADMVITNPLFNHDVIEVDDSLIAEKRENIFM